MRKAGDKQRLPQEESAASLKYGEEERGRLTTEKTRRNM
jgi:hypothetical protein